MKHGDFTGLAKAYSQNRPDYSIEVLKAILGMLPRALEVSKAADVGAGTGIFTRMLRSFPFQSVTGVEPNQDMLEHAREDSEGMGIDWHHAAAESLPLGSDQFDLLSMASSFHWTDFEKAVEEFHRVLKPGGLFVALWNPRYLANSPMLLEIEEYLKTLKGDTIKRVSSGRSDFTDSLYERLCACRQFESVTYLESRHTIDFSPERYLGAWRSVNDIQVQLGEKKFEQFMEYIEDKLSGLSVVKAEYQTRAWVARNA